MNLDIGGPPVIDVPGILGAERAAPRLMTFLEGLVNNQEIQAPLDLTLTRVVAAPRDRFTDRGDDEDEEPIFEIQHKLDDDDIQDTCKALLGAAMNDVERRHATEQTRHTYFVEVAGRAEQMRFTLDLTGSRAQMTAPRRRTEFYESSAEGWGAQQLDVNLQLVDRIVDLAGANISDKDRTIADLRARNERLERVEWELRRRIEQLMDGSDRRRMMIQDFERGQKRKDDYAEGFKNLAPSVVAWAMGPQAGQTAALLAALTQAGPGALSAIASGGMPGMPAPEGEVDGGNLGPRGHHAPDDGFDRGAALEAYHHIDGFVRVLEKRRDIFQALMKFLLSKAPECVTHLHALHQSSVLRRQRAGEVIPASPAPTNGSGAGTNGQAARRG